MHYMPRRRWMQGRATLVGVVGLALLAVAAQTLSLYDQGLRLYSQKDYRGAEQVLRRAVQQNPRSVSPRTLLGATLLQLNM